MADLADLLHKARGAIEAVSTRLDADFLIYHGDIGILDGHRVISLVQHEKRRPNVLLHMNTFGGSADGAYRVVRCLQKHYKRGGFSLFVSMFCKSAGTLVALGADEIVMTEAAELGPLDVQLYKPDEWDERTSGLTVTQALTTLRSEAYFCFQDYFQDLRRSSGHAITTRTAADIATKMTTGLFRAIYAQIEPMRLGESQRAMDIAKQYGTRLARDNPKTDTLDKLLGLYPSHEFAIDRDEAETLFNRVRAPAEDERKALRAVAALIRKVTRLDIGSLPTHESSFISYAHSIIEAHEDDKDEKATAETEQVPPAAGTGTPPVMGTIGAESNGEATGAAQTNAPQG